MKQPKIEDVLPLSPLQEGLLFQTLLDDGGEDLYVSQLLADIEGPLDVKALRGAAKGLLARHANLRAGFQHEGLAEPVQVIPRAVTVPWTQVDLSGLDPVAREAELAARHAADRATRFDLASPPLLRFSVYRVAPGRFRLAMTKHHLLLDGWSMPILVRELFTLYEGGSLPPVTPYRDYLSWIAAQDKDAARDAWRDAMAGLDEPTLLAPADLDPAPARPRTLIRVVPAELSAALHRRARERGLTMSTLTQGAWGLLCGALTGRRDVVFGATVSGRPAEIPGIESMVGLFINTLPVRVRWDWAEPVSAVLERLQLAQSDLMPYQHTHLAEVQRLAGHQKLFDTVSVFQNYPVDSDDDTLSVAGLRISGVPTTDGTHYPLSFAAGTAGPELQLRLSYRADLYSDAWIESTMDRLVRLLSAVCANPDKPVARLDALSSAERRRILAEWNDSTADVAPATIPALFEAQVRARPDAPALEIGDTVVSYAELDARVNRLAHLLVERGVGPEDIVAVSAVRSVGLLVALLAVSKAGAAYLPVDADYPEDRIRYMLDDARPVLAVVDAASAPAIPDLPALVLDDLDLSAYPEHSPGSGRARATPPTSSTPPGRPAAPRASW
ncbi:condensation domain-containing protein [Actinokineospora soli]|uniref:Condensation domain-containing protein n=1 Tax=Actinokineospora soli TaxID=1048753 RepID=A0ABW2TU65_9PSEU